jgi:hypothetical protein
MRSTTQASAVSKRLGDSSVARMLPDASTT